MKYIVELKYTNPAHEHVSLRRRVETLNRIVEAANDVEAINRVTRQQRALGFMVKEARIVKSEDDVKKKKKLVGDDNEKTDIAASGGVEEGAGGTESYPLLKKGEKLKPMALKMGEGFDPEPSDIAAHLVKKHGKGKVTKDHVDAYEKDRDSNKAIDKEAVMKHVQKMSEEIEQVDEQSPAEIKAKYHHDQFDKVKPVKAYDKDGKLVGHYRSMAHAKQMKPGHTYKEVKEEVEQVDEAQKKLKPSYWKAEWRLGTQSEVDKNNKKIFDKLAKTDPVKASAFHDNLMRMKKKDVKEEVVTEASKEGKDVMRNMRASLKSMDLRHGVDSDKREAGYKMSPAVRAAQKKSDELSKVVKRPQAGTLAAVHKSMEREMERNMKKEEVENNSKKKARKAAEKMVNKAKGVMNKINMEPSIDKPLTGMK